MNGIKMLNRQHTEILSLINSIEDYLTNEGLNKNRAKEIRKLISKLSGKLKIHMMKEDKFLYPKLQTRSNEQVKNIAGEFVNKMGNLADEFGEYNKRYILYTEILNNKEDFIQETKEILNRLKDRIAKEDNELYVLL